MSIQQVGTTNSKFHSNFAGAAFSAGAASIAALPDAGWDVIRNTSMGTGVTLNNGSLQIAMPATAGAEFLIVAREDVTIPANLIATLNISARNANQELRIGFLEVDRTSDLLVPNPNATGFARNMASMLFAAAVTTTAILETVSDNSGTRQVTVTGRTATAAGTTLDEILECRAEDITLLQQAADASTSRAGPVGRASVQVPNPNKVYRPFIWVRNTAAAAATVINIFRIISMDIQELQAEIIGRGSNAGSQSVPVQIVANGTTQNVAVASALPTGANTIGNVGLVAGSASIGNIHVNNTSMNAGSNNNQVARRVSTADTNAQSVKAGPGRVMGGHLANTSASWRFVKFHNITTTPTAGSGVVFTIALPPNSVVGVAQHLSDNYGYYFSTGIGITITALMADADVTAIGAGEVLVNLLYV